MSEIAGDRSLHIDTLVSPFGGLIGLTHCPGRCGLDSGGHRWERDLEQDLTSIEAWRADVVVTLIETAEFAKYGVAHFPDAIRRRSFIWHHVPIADFAAPDARTLIAWQKAEPVVRETLARGGRTLFHCAAGLGRTGSMAAKLLVDMELSPADAIALVRSHRPGSIETAAQEAFVTGGARLLPRLIANPRCNVG